MGKANIFYNPRVGRWEVRGRGGVLIATITDTNLPFGRKWHFVGSIPATAGGASMSVATLTNTTGVQRGDIVQVTAKTSNLNGGIVAVSVPSNNLVLLSVFGSLPAMGWDVIVTRPITG